MIFQGPLKCFQFSMSTRRKIRLAFITFTFFLVTSVMHARCITAKDRSLDPPKALPPEGPSQQWSHFPRSSKVSLSGCTVIYVMGIPGLLKKHLQLLVSGTPYNIRTCTEDPQRALFMWVMWINSYPGIKTQKLKKL